MADENRDRIGEYATLARVSGREVFKLDGVLRCAGCEERLEFGTRNNTAQWVYRCKSVKCPQNNPVIPVSDAPKEITDDS